MNEFEINNQILLQLIEEWEPRLSALSDEVVTHRPDNDSWTIKEIVGHMIDSATNNIHRIIHLQYQPSPLIFPDYVNDWWVAIQDYQTENWNDLVQLWKYINKHIVHIIRRVNLDKSDNEWITALGEKVSLRAMIIDYLRHFKLHLSEINERLLNTADV
ncbi:MAG: DinB family protein [Candidatus Azobacteroides sp.]|nr:DinB family protein [Candidatus Azobacteroides sp.]